jgi:hypothetical protein
MVLQGRCRQTDILWLTSWDNPCPVPAPALVVFPEASHSLAPLPRQAAILGRG